jgi:hypothetical protein
VLLGPVHLGLYARRSLVGRPLFPSVLLGTVSFPVGFRRNGAPAPPVGYDATREVLAPSHRPEGGARCGNREARSAMTVHVFPTRAW